MENMEMKQSEPANAELEQSEWEFTMALRVPMDPNSDGQEGCLRPSTKMCWTESGGPEIAETATIDDLRNWLRMLHEVRINGDLVVAEIIGYARQRNWLDEIEVEMEKIGFDQSVVVRALCIADIPKGLRAPGLTAEHYYLVSRMGYDDMARWLKISVEKKLSAMELKKSIEAGRVLTRKDIEAISGQRSGGIVSYQGILTKWRKWEHLVGGESAILEWPKHVLSMWVNEMRPIRDLVDKAEAKINM